MKSRYLNFVLIFFINISIVSSQKPIIKFESPSSIITEDKKSKKIKHYIPVLIVGEITKTLKIKIEDSGKGLAKKDTYKVLQEEFTIEPGNKKSYRRVVEVEITATDEKTSGTETIILSIADIANQDVKLENSNHTIFLNYRGKFTLVSTSVGTNFDYLNGGVQADKLYWDLNYFNPSINSSPISFRTGIYKNRNFSSDSSYNTRYPFEYKVLSTNQEINGEDTLIAYELERIVLDITEHKLNIDNYGLYSLLGFRLNDINEPVNFYFEFLSEIILREFTQTITATARDTNKIVIKEKISTPPVLRGTKTGVSKFSSIDGYLGAGMSLHHLSDDIEFWFSTYLTYGEFNGYVKGLNGITSLLKISFTERNSGIKLNFDYRSRSSARNIFAISLSKTFSLSKSDFFKKK